jgi:hypothetical protein
MSNIIIAPTSAGKTYLADSDPRFVDGDKIIASTIGWPAEHRWWEVLSPAEIVEVHRRNAEVIKNWASKHPDSYVMINEDPVNFDDFHFVIPDLHVLCEHAEKKKEYLKRGPGGTSQPTEPIELKRNRDTFINYALRTKRPWFRDFSTLKDYLGIED